MRCARLRALRAEQSKRHFLLHPVVDDNKDGVSPSEMIQNAIRQDLDNAASLFEDSLYATPRAKMPLLYAEVMAELSVVRFLAAKVKQNLVLFLAHLMFTL